MSNQLINSNYELEYNRAFAEELSDKNENIQILRLKQKIDEQDKKINELTRYFSRLNSFITGNDVYRLNSYSINIHLENDPRISDFSEFFRLNKLTISCCNEDDDGIICNNTLEELIINGAYNDKINSYSVYILPIIQDLPMLRYLKFNNCKIRLNHKVSLLNQLKEHPNKQNIELIINNSDFDANAIKLYKTIGLKSVIVG